jgi:hypothetical protein
VDLKNHKCSCREWQVTGKPCKHALAWILSNRGMQLTDFVHEYYSVARFRATYEGRVEPMTDRSQWLEVNLGFKVYPPVTTQKFPGNKSHNYKFFSKINPCLVRCHIGNLT